MARTTGSEGERWRQEARAVPEFGAFLATLGPLLTLAPKGDGHPVLVLPGLGGDDASTTAMRGVLTRLGYATSGWELGINTGPTRSTIDGLAEHVDRLVAQRRQRISIVGWSMGGVFALGIARRIPADMRQVITLGSPLRRVRRPARQIPITSIYSRTDAIVPWEASLLPDRPPWENVEVDGSHLGLGHNRRGDGGARRPARPARRRVAPVQLAGVGALARDVSTAAQRRRTTGSRHVDDVADGLAGDGAADVVGEQRGHPGERLLRRPGGVRGQQDPVAAPQRAVERQRLGLVDVERGAGEVAALDRLEHGQLVDDPAAAGADDERTGGQRGQPVDADSRPRVSSPRAMRLISTSLVAIRSSRSR